MFDYQMHTTYSDGTTSILDMVKVAERKGLKEIAITDHFFVERRTNRLTVENIPNYFREIEEAQQNNSVKIRVGLEVEFFANREKDIEKVLDEFPFDFILGSTHFVRGIIINRYSLYSGKSQLEAYKEYFKKWRKAVESNLFDVMAHADYIRRWAIPFYGRELPFQDYQFLVEETLQILADNKRGLDVNCSGFRHGVNSTFPSFDFLLLAKELGVKILTIATDSHRPEEVGLHLEKGIEIIKKIGFREVYTFEKRKPKAFEIKEL